MAAKTEMKLYIIRKVMLVIRNNGGSRLHTKMAVLPDYPEPCCTLKWQYYQTTQNHVTEDKVRTSNPKN
jgi:hypothetical protein